MSSVVLTDIVGKIDRRQGPKIPVLGYPVN
jgi:hypothetical protein